MRIQYELHIEGIGFVGYVFSKHEARRVARDRYSNAAYVLRPV